MNMEIEEIKIDSTTVKFFDGYIEEDTTIFLNILGTAIQNVLEKQVKHRWLFVILLKLIYNYLKLKADYKGKECLWKMIDPIVYT